MIKHPQSLFGQRLPQDRLGVLIGLDEGCSSARISRYETGTHAPPFEIAQSLAAVLNVPVAYFYCPQETLAEVLVELYGLAEAELQLVLEELRVIREKQVGVTLTPST